jgi:16S rRNA processing protein RimM
VAESRQPYVTIARLVRPRGNRGELVAEDLSGEASRFERVREVLVEDAARSRREMEVERAWRHKGRLILKFRGIDSISEAEELRGWRVQLPEEEIGPLPAGEFFFRDLVGCQVVDAKSGGSVGSVEDVLEPGGQLLLQVKAEGREILIPFVRSICVEIDPEQQRIRVRMPEGLEDLNS